MGLAMIQGRCGVDAARTRQRGASPKVPQAGQKSNGPPQSEAMPAEGTSGRDARNSWTTGGGWVDGKWKGATLRE